MTRLVIDASVLLSGVIAKPTNPLGRLLTAARAGTFELVACPRIFKEFRRGLNKPYFTNRVLATEAAELLDAFELLAIILPPVHVVWYPCLVPASLVVRLPKRGKP